MSFTPIDLSKLPSPDIVEKLDYKVIYAKMLNDLRQRDKSFSALVESDPVCKILEVVAYRDTLMRQRINDATRGIMLAFATRADLDHVGALFGVERKVIQEADFNAFPPTNAVTETDEDFRYRITLALEGLSTAGPEGSYRYHALKSTKVKDVNVVGPPYTSPGQVLVTILGQTRDGKVSDKVIQEVTSILNAEDVRPITDEVLVQPAEIRDYEIEAILYIEKGPDPNIIINEASKRIQAFTLKYQRLGRDISLSGIYAALHVEGVQRVELIKPMVTIKIKHSEAAFCTSISLTHKVTKE